MMQHQSYFFVSDELKLFLPVFHVHSTTGLVVTLIVFVVLTASYEGFKCLRLVVDRNSGSRRNGVSICSRQHAYQTVLFTLELVLGYLIMLAVMSYNAWVLAAVLTGSFTGFLLCHVLRIQVLSQPPATKAAPQSLQQQQQQQPLQAAEQAAEFMTSL